MFIICGYSTRVKKKKFNTSRKTYNVSKCLKNVETTWVSGKIYRIFRCFNAKTSVQITFLANLTGILVILTHNHHVPCKIPYLKKNILSGSKSMDFCCSVKAICVNEAAIKFNVRSPIWGWWWIDRVADMNMLKVYVPPFSINSSVGTTGLNNAH